MPPTSLQDLKSGKFWLALAAEFIGTQLLVLVACGSCANFLPDEAHADKVVQISLAFGFSVATIVWSIAHVSGGHINPAVTMGFLATRKISLARALLYMIFQTLGAIVGAGLLKFMIPGVYNQTLGSSLPKPNLSAIQVLGIETIITFVLVWTVFATCDSNRKAMAGSGPLAIGLSIAMCHLWAVPYTGAGMNPARVFGASLVSHNLQNSHHWAYWVGPLIGGAFAGHLYDLVFAANASVAKLKGFFSRHYDDADYDTNGRKPAADPNQSGIHLKDSS